MKQGQARARQLDLLGEAMGEAMGEAIGAAMDGYECLVWTRLVSSGREERWF
jgi:hypothetical protein